MNYLVLTACSAAVLGEVRTFSILSNQLKKEKEKRGKDVQEVREGD